MKYNQELDIIVSENETLTIYPIINCEKSIYSLKDCENFVIENDDEEDHICISLSQIDALINGLQLLKQINGNT